MPCYTAATSPVTHPLCCPARHCRRPSWLLSEGAWSGLSLRSRHIQDQRRTWSALLFVPDGEHHTAGGLSISRCLYRCVGVSVCIHVHSCLPPQCKHTLPVPSRIQSNPTAITAPWRFHQMTSCGSQPCVPHQTAFVRPLLRHPSSRMCEGCVSQCECLVVLLTVRSSPALPCPVSCPALSCVLLLSVGARQLCKGAAGQCHRWEARLCPQGYW